MSGVCNDCHNHPCVCGMDEAEGGGRGERVVRLRTPNGSTVTISGKHMGIYAVDFDWFEEDACCDCEPDIDSSRATNWTTLIWSCCECAGGQAPLMPVDA